jgi:hypothetical protein
MSHPASVVSPIKKLFIKITNDNKLKQKKNGIQNKRTETTSKKKLKIRQWVKPNCNSNR